MADSREHPVDGAELARLFRLASRRMARACHRCDNAHHAQSLVLDILREQGPVSQRDLLRQLDVRSSSLSEVLAKLELGGHIARERNPEDRRGFLVSATGPGPATVPAPGDADADALFACLDDGEKQRLRDILAKLATSLDEDAVQGPCGFGGPHGRGRGGYGRGQGFGKGRGRGRG